MKTLSELGFRKRPKPLQLHKPIQPDVDYPNHDERTPQATNYTQMWTDHFSNLGNIHNPVGSPMESGA
jgi:hypothetical protein